MLTNEHVTERPTLQRLLLYFLSVVVAVISFVVRGRISPKFLLSLACFRKVLLLFLILLLILLIILLVTLLSAFSPKSNSATVLYILCYCAPMSAFVRMTFCWNDARVTRIAALASQGSRDRQVHHRYRINYTTYDVERRVVVLRLVHPTFMFVKSQKVTTLIAFYYHL